MSRLTRKNKSGEFYIPRRYEDENGNNVVLSNQDCINELAHYEDLEEQGRLIELPCAVGDTVWELCKCVDGMYRVYPGTVKVLVPQGSIRRIKNESPSIWNLYATSEYTYMYKSFSDFGKTVFTTKEAAEAKLAEIEGVE